MHELPDRDGEATDGEAEDYDGNAGPNPSQKGALVGEVVASPAGIRI